MLIRSDARHIPLKANSVQMVCTSPPYWGLRDYSVAGQIGLERTYQEYIDVMVEVFREVWRVLKDDGTLWLVMGDSYYSGNRGGYRNDGHRWERSQLQRANRGNAETIRPNRLLQAGLKSKDLVGIPWRVALALQADGWYLRSDIIWHKPNPMPESVRGTHYTRHRVTIDEYERLSCLQYVCECAGNAWAGDMPPLSEGQISHRKASLSTEPERYHHCSCERSTRGRSGEEAYIQSVATREKKQSKIRTDSKGPTDESESDTQVSTEPTGEGTRGASASTHQEQSNPKASATSCKCQIQENTKRAGTEASPVRQAKRRDLSDEQDADSIGVDRDSGSSDGSLSLLQTEAQADTGPCDPAEQGWAAHEDQCGSRVRSVQFEEEGQDPNAVLVGCPGCPQCIKHHGYIFHLSAGRPTRSHEYIFLLTKSALYYYNADAIREKSITGDTRRPYGSEGSWQMDGRPKNQRHGGEQRKAKQLLGSHGAMGHDGNGMRMLEKWNNPEGRNCRSVWTIAPKPFAGAHFATFPPALAERCILAGCPPGGIVLDPFAGSGTTVMVARALGRIGIGCDLAYHDLARQRIFGPLFAATFNQ